MDYSQDRSAAKLKGHNCVVKFKDGEELYFTIDDFKDADSTMYWLQDVENLINGSSDKIEWFPIPTIAVSTNSIKYVMVL